MKPKTDPVSRLWKTEMILKSPKHTSSYIPGIDEVDDSGESITFVGRISHTTISSVNPENGIPLTNTIIKLFCSPQIPITQGSTLYVPSGNSEYTIYSCAGIPAIYNKHQEVVLEFQKKGR